MQKTPESPPSVPHCRVSLYCALKEILGVFDEKTGQLGNEANVIPVSIYYARREQIVERSN